MTFFCETQKKILKMLCPHNASQLDPIHFLKFITRGIRFLHACSSVHLTVSGQRYYPCLNFTNWIDVITLPRWWFWWSMWQELKEPRCYLELTIFSLWPRLWTPDSILLLHMKAWLRATDSGSGGMTAVARNAFSCSQALRRNSDVALLPSPQCLSPWLVCS